jgi:hypothetical protein
MLTNTTTRFSDSVIKLELRQHDVKVLFVAMQALLLRLDTQMPPDEFKSLLDDAHKYQGIKFSSEITQNMAEFAKFADEANTALHDAYSEKTMEYVDAILAELNEHFDEHYDREIFNLAEGETLKIEASGLVYG